MYSKKQIANLTDIACIVWKRGNNIVFFKCSGIVSQIFDAMKVTSFVFQRNNAIIFHKICNATLYNIRS